MGFRSFGFPDQLSGPHEQGRKDNRGSLDVIDEREIVGYPTTTKQQHVGIILIGEFFLVSPFGF